MSRHRLALLGVILVAFFLRVRRLPETPPGLWYDEAYYALDARWMAETGEYPIFFVGNNGREPIWIYLLWLSTALFGDTTFAVRLPAALAGTLTVPLLYCFARRLLRPFITCPHPPAPLSQRERGKESPPSPSGRGAGDRRKEGLPWLALTAAGWLAVSWWHLHLSRAGFRVVLLPPLLILSLYFFHRALSSLRHSSFIIHHSPFALAGLFLGLSQYTYLSGRLAPLIVGGLAMAWALPAWRAGRLKQFWLGTAVTGLVAAMVFAPLGLFFWSHPAAFSSRTADVLVAPVSAGELLAHLLQGVSLFFGAGHDLYRHHLPGRAMLGWLEIPFFWFGLWVLWRGRRQPETALLLLGLGVMWLPALLASPPVHALRPVGLLPFYYLVVALGAWWVLPHPRPLSLWERGDSLSPSPFGRGGQGGEGRLAAAVAIFVAVNGLVNGYDYFGQWAQQPEVYQEYNGPLVDFGREVVTLTKTNDLIIPFHVYAHPTMRFLLADFVEAASPPPEESGRPLKLAIVPDTFQLLYVGNVPVSSAMVLLREGRVYVSRPPRADEQADLDTLLAGRTVEPFRDRLGREVAGFVSLPAGVLAPLFEVKPLRTVQLIWGLAPDKALVQLQGYEVTPELARPGQPITINFYWRSLTNAPFEHRLFLQLIDRAGQPLTQWEGEAFREDMYRWRPGGLLPTQHTLWLGPETPPGPYLLRMGFFDEQSGERLPLLTTQAPDQVELGLFYVSPAGSDPRRPATPLAATFAETTPAVELTGVTIPQISNLKSQTPNLPVTFHWQAIRPTAKNYTVFLQLLNEHNEVVAGWDEEPLAGHYPTTRWSPGEVIADTFLLPLPAGGLPPGDYRLIAGLYDFETGQRLPATTAEGVGDFVELERFVYLHSVE